MADKSQTDDNQPDNGPGDAQDPYPVDPSNELLDGDNVPSKEELAEADVKVADSGRALLHKDAQETAEGAVYVPPPQSANLERKKTLEKIMAASAESVGEVSVEGEAQRAKAASERRAANEQKAGQDQPDASSDEKKAQARKQPPQGRSTGSQSKA